MGEVLTCWIAGPTTLWELGGEPVRLEDAGDVWAMRELPITFTPGRRIDTEAL